MNKQGMTNKDAIQFLKNMITEKSASTIGKEGFFVELMGYHIESLKCAIKAIETLDKIGETVYRDEYCPNKTRCYDYIGYHCATCMFSPKRQRGEADNEQ